MKIFFIFLSFIIFQSQAIYSQTIDRIECVIGDRIILTSDIEMKYLQYISQGVTNSDNLKCSIIEDLIYEKMLSYKAELDSLEVGDKEVNDEVEKRIEYYISQIGSEEKMEEYFKKSSYDIRFELKQMVKEQFLAQRMQSDITSNVKITPSEVRSFYNNLNESEIPQIESQVTISQIIIKPEIDENEKEKVREKLNSLRKRVLAGEDFRVLATLYSDDPSATQNGGEIGFVSRGDLLPEFEKVAFRLKENEISGIVQSEYGFHIIQHIERRGEDINVRHILIKPKISSLNLQEAKKNIDEVEALIKNSSISFSEAVKNYSDDVSKSNDGLLVNPSTGSTSFSINDLGPSLKYLVENMKVGDISSPVIMELEDGSQGYRMILIKEKKDAHLANLLDDYELIQDQALNNKKQKKINKWINAQTKQTYVYLTNQFTNCDFQFKWVQ